MPNNTVNFGLPYPAPSDAPCLFAEQWCDFTNAVNAVLATFQTGIDRAVPVVPAALIHTETSRSIPDRNLILFDEVAIDTAGMTDLDADPYHITIKRTGRYTVGGFIQKATSGVVNSEVSLVFQGELPSGLDIVTTILDRNVAISYLIPGYGPALSLTAGDRVSLFCNAGTSANQTIEAAWMSVIWHSDTEVP